MGKGHSKKVLIVLALISLALISPNTPRAQTLQPRLLWQKTLPFKIGDLRMAYESGDLMIFSREARQIILLDRDGNKTFHWGPRLDRQPMGIDISDDGNTIIYVTTWTESYLERKKTISTWDKRVHYSTRKGKELWNRSISGMPVLSPDGKMIAIGPSAGEGSDLTAIDSQGKTLWKYISREAMDIIFSSDSNYLIFYGENGLHLLDKIGKGLRQKYG